MLHEKVSEFSTLTQPKGGKGAGSRGEGEEEKGNSSQNEPKESKLYRFSVTLM